MTLRVGALQQSLGLGSRIDTVIRETLTMIDARIREADRFFGRNVVEVELDTSFNLPGLTKVDEQRFVYSKIITSLAERGFEVKIVLSDKTILLIAFTLDFSKNEVDAMSNILRAARLGTREAIDEFCDRRPAPAATPNAN